jgi:hypothetical protein
MGSEPRRPADFLTSLPLRKIAAPRKRGVQLRLSATKAPNRVLIIGNFGERIWTRIG